MTKVIKEIPFGGKTLILETGEIARQADAAVMVRMGDTMVLVTAVAKKTGAERNDFFPLTVNYQEKFYAAGKIPGGFTKREGRPSDAETLIARLIDRPLRPLFPEGFRNEVQVVATVLSLDDDVCPDVLAMIGASAALTLSGVPFQGPIGCARVGFKDGVYSLNPSEKDLKESELDLVVAGTDSAILMVESQAKELSEDVMLGAVLYGHEMMQSVITGIKELNEEAGSARWDWQPAAFPEALYASIVAAGGELLTNAYLEKEKALRYEQLGKARESIKERLFADNEELAEIESEVDSLIAKLEKDIVRTRILDGEPRIDGRDLVSVRPISIRTGVLPRAHGSALFTRGETQALVVATLGNDRDAKLIDSIMGESKDRFMLHYNFPAYCVGETGMMLGPKRREIGHGQLAKRAILGVMPEEKDCPYVLRVVSEITESNGSSSMASACGTSLALMDAGVKTKAPVAGVAMGLIKDGEKFAVLTDILGDEDHLGDMDFKVAGSATGVTALQMDIKITGITKEIMEQALEQANKGRNHILGVMENAISAPNQNLSPYAPRIETMKVPEDKIRDVIGKGGSTIKSITEKTGVSIDISDDGTISLFSPDLSALEEAKLIIKTVTASIEAGETYNGAVSKIVDFGAFINLLPGKDGLLHISRICDTREQKVSEFLEEGQEIEVLVEDVDKMGRIKLKWLNKPAKEEAPAEESTEKAESQEAKDGDNGAGEDEVDGNKAE